MPPDDVRAETKAWDSAVLRRLWRFAHPHRRRFAAGALILATLFALELAAPWMLKSAIDGPVQAAREARAAAAGTDGSTPDTSRQLSALFLWGLAYLAVVGLAAFFRFLESRQLTRTGQAVVHDLRTHLFAHIGALDLAWFDRHPTGALVTRVTSDIENLSELFTSGLIALLFDLIKVLVVAALLVWVSPPLAFLVLVLAPLLVGVSLIFRGGARRAHREVRARLAQLNGYLQEVLSGIRVVQVFGREARVSQRFAEHLADYNRANFRTIRLFALFFPIIAWLTVLIQAAILLRGGALLTGGTVTAGEFILFWFWLQFFVGPIRELGERYNVLQAAFASADRIFAILDTTPAVRPAPSPTPLATPFRGHVRFEDVVFAYDPRVPVLHEISFEIRPGETVALVGATGSGKSTIVNLLLRFYDPTAGRVTIDGTDLRDLDTTALRQRLGLVLQEDFLFAGTVRANLELGRAGVSPESLARALETSAADFVQRLPQGLDTTLDERGGSLSTGERELIAIARALAAGPDLVILDEATASVDSATEARIEHATHDLLRGRSALVVAHRLSTVRRADRILVMHHGRLRESGTHAELLARGGLYAKLHALQFRDDEDDGPRA
jgi:ATP-binding cassette subfamily B multidrug efflux pump